MPRRPNDVYGTPQQPQAPPPPMPEQAQPNRRQQQQQQQQFTGGWDPTQQTGTAPTPEEQRRRNQARGVAGLPTGDDPNSIAARRAFRQKVAANEQAVEDAARSGKYRTVEEFLQATGRTGTKDGGGARLKALYGEGGLYSTYGGGVSPNHIYDWVNGRKYDVATSDQNKGWEPITAAERQSYQMQQQRTAGGTGSYFQGLLQDEVAHRRQVGDLTMDPATGLLYNPGGNPGDTSSWTWVDPKTGYQVAAPQGAAERLSAGGQQPQQRPDAAPLFPFAYGGGPSTFVNSGTPGGYGNALDYLRDQMRLGQFNPTGLSQSTLGLLGGLGYPG